MKKVKRLTTYAIIAVVIVVGIAVTKNKFFSDGNSKVLDVNRKISVEVQQAKIIEKSSGDVYKATLESYEEGIISSKISGKVVQILFENGKSVSQGESLIVLDDTDVRNQLKTAESQLNMYESQLKISENQLKVSENQLQSPQIALQKLQTNLETMQRNYDRMKTLIGQGTISQTDFEDADAALKNAKTDYESGKASVETAKSNVESSRVSIEASKANVESSQVSIGNLQSSLENTVIKAPFSGVIDGKSVDLGQMASPGAVLAKVNDTSSIYAVIQVEQEKVKNIKLGQKAVVTINNGEDKSYEGVVKRIDVSADPSARVFNCKIQIDNKDNSMHPGVFAKAQIVSDEKDEIIVIPIQALVGNEGDYYVFVSDNGVAKKHRVTIGESDKNVIEIKSGIKNQDKIICTNISTLQDGDKIQIVSK